jgi:hypothetical protein
MSTLCHIYVRKMSLFVTFKMSQMTFFRHSKLTILQSLLHTNSSRIHPTKIPLSGSILIYVNSQSINLRLHEIVLLMIYFLSNFTKSLESKCQLKYLVSNKIGSIHKINMKILSIFYVYICLSLYKRRGRL